MEPARFFACYREFAPRQELREYVRALFTFGPADESFPAGRLVTSEVLFQAGDSFSSPLFADGNGSMVVDLARLCHADGVWRPSDSRPHAKVIGPMTAARPGAAANLPAMIGVYFNPARLSSVATMPADELTDSILPIGDLWRHDGFHLAEEMSELDQAARIERLELALLRRIRRWRTSQTSVNVAGLATEILQRRGCVSVESLADAAGVSRQHLTRSFRDLVGLSPKLYCRLARFQASLAFAGPDALVEWARAAAQLGYADQSHMIAEFREFSSVTPAQIVAHRWFHPFIERARPARDTRGSHSAVVAGTRATTSELR